jgi:hypothetical protein
VALIVTSLIRRRLGLRAWRAVHWAAYACWPAAVLHGLGTGTDARSGWFELLTAACVIAVLVTVSCRVIGGWPSRRGLRLGALGLTAATFCAGTAFALAGPLAPGWARRAGTPVQLLASVRQAPRRAASDTARAGLPLPFDGSLQGTIQRSATTGQTAQVDIVATVQGVGRPARVEVRIAGRPLADGGLQMSSSAVSLGTAAQPDLYAGRIVSLSGAQLLARLHRPGARPVSLQLALQLANGSSQVTGTATAREAG